MKYVAKMVLVFMKVEIIGGKSLMFVGLDHVKVCGCEQPKGLRV